MSRLAPLDKALVLILVPVWLVVFALGVRTQIEGGGLALVRLSLADSESYPVLTGEFAPTYPSNPLEEAGLRAGDLLVRAGTADLRGVGGLAFVGLVQNEAGRALDVSLVYERDGVRGETSLGLRPASTFRPWLVGSFALAASALLLLARARLTPSVRTYFLAAFCVAIVLCVFRVGGTLHAWVGSSIVAGSLGYPLLLRFAQIFPDDVAPEGRWHRIWPWAFSVWGLFWFLYFVERRFALGWTGIATTNFLALTALLVVFTRKFLRSGPVTRRQMKWLLFAAWCALLPMAAAHAISFVEPRLAFLATPSFWAIPIFPAALVVSIVRYNLFDIDRLLSGAISYTVLVILLAIGGEVLLEPLAGRAAGVLGIAPATGQVAFVALLAAVLIPAQRFWRPYVDRVFFAEGRSREQEVEALLGQLVQTDSRGAVVERTGAGIERAFRPEFCAIYERAGEQFEPSYATGAAEFPAIPAASEFIRALEIRVSPILLDARGASEAPAALRIPPVPRAAAIVPLRPGGALLAFIAIGPKQSGDVYPSTDLSLLATLGHTVSTQLGRLSHTSIA